MIHSWRHQQVNMVCHEDPTMNIDTKPDGPIFQPVSIGRDISITGEQCLAVVSPLNNVDRIAHRTPSAPPRQTPTPFSQKTD